MSASSTPGLSHLKAGLSRLKKSHKLSIAGVSAVATAALAFSLVPGNAAAGTETQALAATPVALAAGADTAQTTAVHSSLTQQHKFFDEKAKAEAEAAAKKKAAEAKKAAAKKKAADAKKAAAKKKAAEAKKAAAKKAADAKKKAKAQADAKKRAKAQAASRAAARKPVYANNLDGWIREALDIMKKNNIPGSYQGIHRNIIRESGGNPNAINNWDINAINGVPSIGLLQVIKPTFDAYHVAGTEHSQYDPVANIVAACNYAADRYGSMDNVNGAY